MAINILDSMIINRISAGEVVESPFSIVKELIDNSIDAGADKISVDITNGGISQIVVKDNGKGIDYDDIKKAFLPHATSKIKNIEDLEAIGTLGFRGEALASISNVSQVLLQTKTANSDCAYSIEVSGGVFGQIQPTVCNQGTTIEINNLFFNTPARRKFLKKPKLEENQITNIITRYILAHPEISFKYSVDGDVIYQTNGKSLEDAICCVYGKEISQNIMPIEKTINNISLSGYVSKVGFSKPNTTYQTLIINSRYVVDEIVSKAVYMAFEEYLMPRQFPFYVLNLTMPKVDIDVNVHPSKMNIKFANPNEIYDLVYSAIRSAIYQLLNPVENTFTENEFANNEEPLIKTDISNLQEITIEPNQVSPILPRNVTLKQEEEAQETITIFDLANQMSEADLPAYANQQTEETLTSDYVNINNLFQYKIVGQLFNEFIVLEKDEYMILLDFHAGHERLNYDKLLKMVNERNLVVQDLLVPYLQEMSEVEVGYILELKDELNKLGFDIDSFGNKKIVINSIPLQLKDINLKSFVDDLLHDMKNIKPKINTEITHYLMQKACKSSVKSGMTLSEMEIKELLKDIDMKKPVLLCPHGRPVITVFTKNQIEKWFKRIV